MTPDNESDAFDSVIREDSTADEITDKISGAMCPDCGGCGENSEAIRCGYCGGEGVIPGSDSEDDDSDEALAESAHEARLERMYGFDEPFGEEDGL